MNSINSAWRAAKWPRLLVLVVAAACTDSDLPVETGQTPATVAVVSGDEQSAPAGTELANPVVVRISNESGDPIPNQTINFAVTSGEGSVASSSSRTDEQGMAQTRWTLGAATDVPQTLEARAAGGVVAAISATALEGGAGANQALLGLPARECATPKSGWIWCDDFEQNRLGSYFEYDNAGGNFARAGAVGVNGSYGMRARFNAGQVSAGSLKLAFGRTPDPYMDPVDAGTAKYKQIFWRIYLRNASNWTGGGGDKLTRAIVFARSDWSEAAIGHVWSGSSSSNRNYLLTEAVSGTDAAGNLRTRGYNDFANMRWIGSKQGTTPLFSSSNVGEWYCVEARMRLNDLGESNGIFDLWIDGKLQGRTSNLNWRGSYNSYGINALFLENFWNNGSPQRQDRFIDNLVVSTSRIGCGSSTAEDTPPAVSSVSVSPTSSSIAAGATRQYSAVARDASGNTISGETFSWSSSNTAAATVSSSGMVTGRGAGTSTIRATTDGKTGSATVTVQIQAPTVASVTVSPTSASLSVGGTRQLSATARDASGNPISGKTFTWSSTNTSVASVSSSGLATARAAGTATVRATVNGKTASAAITVTSSTPPPSSGSADFVEDFEYSTVSAMLSSDNYIDYEAKGAGNMSIISDGYGGSNAVRSTWPASYAGEIRLPVDVRRWGGEWWAEYWFRIGSTWSMSNVQSWKFMGIVAEGHSWRLEFSNGSDSRGLDQYISSPYQYSAGVHKSMSQLRGTGWHRIRIHFSNSGSGHYDVQMDDGVVKKMSFAPQSGTVYFMSPTGLNRNNGGSGVYTNDVSRLRAFFSNPSWSGF